MSQQDKEEPFVEFIATTIGMSLAAILVSIGLCISFGVPSCSYYAGKNIGQSISPPKQLGNE